MTKPVILEKFFHFLDPLDKILLGLSKLATFLMMFFITADVLARRVFEKPIVGVVELTTDYLMIALIYFAISSVYMAGGHARVTLFITAIPAAMIKPVNTVLNFFGLVFFGIMTWKGLEAAIKSYQMKEVSNSLIAYPIFPAYLVVFLGALLMSLRILQHLFESPVDSEEILE